MSYTTTDFKRDVKEILAICEEDLQAIAAGEHREATVEQIEGTIIPEMNQLLEIIERNEIPPRGQNKRWILSAAYITRSWNWDIWSEEKLVRKLPVLATNYMRNLQG